MRQLWWKIICIALLVYTVTAGFLIKVPIMYPTYETLRNLFFHVPMWFGMMALFTVSLVYSIKFFKSRNLSHDLYAQIFAHVGTYMGVLGFATGMLWGKYVWGDWLPKDPKIIGAAIAVLIYFAYFILRSAVNDEEKKAHLSASYNIFAYVMMIIFTGVYPRMHDSLHPGNGGNPGFNAYDTNSTMLMVFYPAVAGWILLGVWISLIKIRIELIKSKI
ncbi:MAG: cytochrome c biogenesis protein CcsA [Flavobacteriales bacterium]